MAVSFIHLSCIQYPTRDRPDNWKAYLPCMRVLLGDYMVCENNLDRRLRVLIRDRSQPKPFKCEITPRGDYVRDLISKEMRNVAY